MFVSKPGRATLFVGVILGAVGMAQTTGAAPAGPQPAYDVVRVGDGQMSCTDLAGEINQLTRDIAAERVASQAQAESRARSAQASAENTAMARRLAMGGLVHASAFIPFGGGLAAMAVRSAAMNAASTAANTPASVTTVIVPQAPVETPQSLRLAALQGIFGRKAC